VFVKRAGFKYENFRIKLKNAFDAGKDTFPDDVIKASRRLGNWQPPYVAKQKEISKDKALQFHQSNGEQHYEQKTDNNRDDNNNNANNANMLCFKCERSGHLTKECKFNKKENGDDLNNYSKIQKFYEERAAANKQAGYEARKEKRNVKEAGASQHFADSAIEETDDMLDFEQAILDEDEHDRQGFMLA
jgi:hypothetical protein